MWSRWDMQDSPPDILITNYSMLNIMLMRSMEIPVFDLTQQWLAADHSHVFHLAVDELHSYRGTPGTEVAYLIRVLLDRLGLPPDSDQLRIIASSASLTSDTSSREYLYPGRVNCRVDGHHLCLGTTEFGISLHCICDDEPSYFSCSECRRARSRRWCYQDLGITQEAFIA